VISRRRMVFQLTALLDLLLVVLFAQYIETQEVTRRAIRSEAARRAKEASLRIQAEQLTKVTEAERQESEKLKRLALADRSQLTDQIEKLTSENQRLQSSLTRAQAKLGQEHEGRVEDQKRAAEELAQIGELFRERLNIDPKTLNGYLDSASPGERDKFLEEMQRLKGARSASVVQYLRATVEFKKMCNLWEIHIFDDNSVRLRFDGKEYGKRIYPVSANDFANQFIEAARDNGEPRSLVVVLLTFSNADQKTCDEVSTGLREATTVLRTAWGNTKRIEVSKLGYTPEAP
jgi:hypothetical protein